MRIDDPNLRGVSSPQVGQTGQAEAATRQGRVRGTGQAGGADTVELSGLASSLGALSPESPERAAWLEKLSADVEAGRYKVDAEAVSRAIVGEALSGGGKAES